MGNAMSSREDIEKQSQDGKDASRLWWKLSAEDREFLRSCNIDPC